MRVRRRMPGLSRYDSSRDATPQARQARHALMGGAKQELPLLGVTGGCWCGEEQGHDWPGKAEGAPHPRESR